ncbi:phosphodiesterase [Mesotoga sp. Brook.08.YT.4.2.5.1]|uniref:alkaline phosphatase family protein n=1 Tax=unclassified Mesotoga TaxID=1184398 RepID=UPI000C198380|nr:MULTISPECIES: alkaline phosphatase family protein [unclassified Mesotoga]RAM58554.1 phosphodiesterase [Mesotoga sp. SC_4PWL113PWK15]PNE23414.1 phosphodiesterase [Mesotoga sp. Brook.08.YT.4.2.5.1]PNS39917.1 phosphodiesterase [Mesotoga sp. B105.6.4]PVD16135.1 phosphodiesterase [Mesotoga sp. Brook.08.105.5.1]RAO97535.1 phosphodiesterase [Mesotoga sp. Brook.08.YT.4.2.5.4.]
MEFIYPNYDTGSIVNLSAAILKHFDAEIPSGVKEYCFSEHGISIDGIDKLVVFIIDAVGYYNLMKVLEKSSFKHFSVEDVRSLTSVFPSTTSSALTSLFTATTPGEHGVLGYLLNIPEYGGLVNMIELTPYTQDRDNLTRLGFDPLKYNQNPTIFESLKEAGVKGYHLTSKSFVNTGLTRMHSRGGIARGVHGLGDMFEELNTILAADESESLTVVYWGLIDTYGHKYGPNSLSFTSETAALISAIEGFFDETTERNTAFFITADHGQIETPWEQEIWWSKFDDIFDEMYSMPGGEQRMSYIYSLDKEKTRKKMEELFGDSIEIIEPSRLDEIKLFGRPLSNSFRKRIGELITVSKDDSSLCFKYTGQEHSLKGRHGGLTKEEMNVPLILLRRD